MAQFKLIIKYPNSLNACIFADFWLSITRIRLDTYPKKQTIIKLI